MKLKTHILNALCLIAGVACLQSQTILETFEYENDEALAAAWGHSANATLALSDSVAAPSTGQKALQVTFNFPSTAFATEIVSGPTLPAEVSIGASQYVSFRIKGDPAFATADFKNLYLYVYDADGNFGRWGAPVPTTTAWQVANYLASTIEKPWDSTALPDLAHIVRFSFFQYGSEAAIPAYTASISIDDVTVRDTPLADTPPVVETIIDAFEYESQEALAAAWRPSPNAVLATTTFVSANSPGTTAMQVTFNFPSTAFTTETVSSLQLETPVAIAPEQYLTFRLKSDPAFSTADFKNLYLYAYDADGKFGRWGGPVHLTDAWLPVNYLASTIEQPWDSTGLPDLTRIVRFAFFQYGSEAAIPPYTAIIALDDLAVKNAAVVDVPPTPESMIEDFEYETPEEFLAAWVGLVGATVSPTTDVTPRAGGPTAMQVDLTFPSGAWATSTVRGPTFETPLSLATSQYLTFRVKGDPAFATADFKTLYLYAYDADGKFGRWGKTIPSTTEWVVWNFSVGSIEQPWDSAGLPNLSQITRLAFLQYGSEAALPEYTASIGIDEIMVRNSPLTEFPLPAAAGSIIENFESYPSATELLAFYSYVSQPAGTVTTATLETPAPEGSKALKLAIDFAAGQYPWGSIRSPRVAPFSFPADATISMRFKGDAALAPVADAGTTFWLTLYDAAGGSISYIAPASVVTNPEWTTLTATLADFGDHSTVDIGNIVQWRILVQGWQGTAETAALSGAFYVDDIKMVIPEPTLSITLDGTSTTISWPFAIVGYILESADTLVNPTWTPVDGVVQNQVSVSANGTKFFRLKK